MFGCTNCDFRETAKVASLGMRLPVPPYVLGQTASSRLPLPPPRGRHSCPAAPGSRKLIPSGSLPRVRPGETIPRGTFPEEQQRSPCKRGGNESTEPKSLSLKVKYMYVFLYSYTHTCITSGGEETNQRRSLNHFHLKSSTCMYSYTHTHTHTFPQLVTRYAQGVPG